MSSISRSRNGCITCRIRKVKCDEEKPHCQRCISTGRKCNGYVSRKESQNSLRIIQYTARTHQPEKPLPTVDFESAAAGLAFQFFQIQTRHAFQPQFALAVLRAAHYDPAIRHAVTAVGVLHESFIASCDPSDTGSLVRTQLCISEYNKAIRALIEPEVHSPSRPPDNVLILSLLFYTLESLQAHYALALKHIVSGLKLIKEFDEGGVEWENNTYLPGPVVRSQFTRLETQVIEMSGTSLLPWQLHPRLSLLQCLPASTGKDKLTSIEEAANIFESIYNSILKFLILEEVVGEEEDGTNSTELQTLHEEYLSCGTLFRSWSIAFDDYLRGQASGASSSEQESEAAQSDIIVLRIWQLVGNILFAVGFPPSEMAWDDYVLEFSTMILLAGKLLELIDSSAERAAKSDSMANIAKFCLQMDPRSSAFAQQHGEISQHVAHERKNRVHSLFSAKLGIIPCLFLCGHRCRDSRIRRKAADVLRASRRREGIWDSNVVSRIIVRISQIEGMSASLVEGADYAPADIPLAARVLSSFPTIDDSTCRVRFVISPREGVYDMVQEVFT